MRDFGSIGSAPSLFAASTKRSRSSNRICSSSCRSSGREVAARLLFEQREDVDHLLRGRQVRFRGMPLDRIRDVAEVHGGRVRERHTKATKLIAGPASPES